MSTERKTTTFIFLLFFKGALISACRDNFIHLWNLRQKKPVIANSLRFVKEKFDVFLFICSSKKKTQPLICFLSELAAVYFRWLSTPNGFSSERTMEMFM